MPPSAMRRRVRAAGFERCGGELAVGAGGRRIELGECGEQRVTLRPELAGMLAVPGGDAQQYVAERRQSEAGFLRKVRPAEERPLPFVRQEHGERPAATALREHLLRDLVDAVDVGTLLAIDFDVDEVVVEDARGGFVFEALFMEDVAPMTGGVTHAQMNRFVFPARALERLGLPRIPLDGIVSVLA